MQPEGTVVETTIRSRPLVLIVEDEGDIAQLIARVLSPSKYDFLLTSTGADALRYAAEARPDVITLDLMLPDVAGTDVLARLKESALTRDIPVIIVSIRADDSDLVADDAFALLSKPIDRESLRSAVAGALTAGVAH